MSTIFTHIYNDGYSLGAMDCGHTPAAVAAGTFNREFYYYYSLLYAFKKRWLFNETWELKENLNVLGLDLKYYDESDVEEAIKKMSAIVAEDKPVIMFVPYNKLFYTIDYNTVNNAKHGLLFIGYEDLRDSFMIMDSVQMWGANQEFDGKAETFIRLPLSRSVFTIMLEDIKEAYADENGEHFIPFFAIERIRESTVNCYSELFCKLLKVRPRSRFLEIMDNIDIYRSNADQNRDNPSRLRQQLNGTTEIISRSVQKFLEEKIYTEQLKTRVENEINSYSETSDKVSLWLLKHIISPMPINPEKLSKKMLLMEQSESKFFSIIEEINNLGNKNDKMGLINLTSFATVSADSGYPLIIHPGKEDATVIWDSMTEPKEHFMTVDLQTTREVRIVNILHSGLSGLTTSDFKLLSSVDGETYTVVSEREFNKETVTKFHFDNLRCRYVRLYVVKTNNYECNTKIRGFQVIGR